MTHKVFCIAKYSNMKGKSICPPAKAWPELVHATMNPNGHQHIYNRIREEEMHQWSSRGFAPKKDNA